VQETLADGASVSQVAQRHGVNANQVFQWRRQYRVGDLSAQARTSTELLAVTVAQTSADEVEQAKSASPSGAIHIELHGCTLISIEPGADATMVRVVLESLRR
jgi:transposase